MASIVDQLLGEFDISYIASRLDYTEGFTQKVLNGDISMSATFKDKLDQFNSDEKYLALTNSGAPISRIDQLATRSWATVNEATATYDQVVALTAANKGLDPEDVRKALSLYGTKTLQEYQDIAIQGGSA